ncbi:hypothetical protein FQR65_LT07850 [Abscondita terminalis]|nr:hypothetical protein FQR65_LT07850 [Abscondita terminalis]
MSESAIKIIVGNIIHCSKPFVVDVIENGFIAVQDSKIKEVGKKTELEDFKKKNSNATIEETILNDSQVLIPGFIDTHIHASQYLNLGLGLNKPLLQWLDENTFPLEKQFKDPKFAKKAYEAVVKRTLSNGTTTASYYATIHTDSSLILADVAIEHGQRALIGKVNMTQNSPSDYIETSQSTLEDTKLFIKGIIEKNSTLVQPVLTPRFAISLTFDDMKELGKLAEEHKLRIQTHMCESKGEIEQVVQIFGKEYGQVYLETGLLTNKSIIAHLVHVSQSELERLGKQKSSVAHCPSSNYNLRSGICDVKRLVKAGLNVGLGSDISGGSNVGIVGEMRYAMIASTTLSFEKDNYEPVNYADAFYLATLGGAKTLTLDNVVGNFDVGKEFDALIIDIKSEEVKSKEDEVPISTSSKNVEDIKKHLTYIESHIPQEKLQLFKDSGPTWLHEVEYTELFQLWFKINETINKEVTEIELEPQENVISSLDNEQFDHMLINIFPENEPIEFVVGEEELYPLLYSPESTKAESHKEGVIIPSGDLETFTDPEISTDPSANSTNQHKQTTTELDLSTVTQNVEKTIRLVTFVKINNVSLQPFLDTLLDISITRTEESSIPSTEIEYHDLAVAVDNLRQYR